MIVRIRAPGQGIVLTRRRGQSLGRWSRDPYGRGGILKFIGLQFGLLYGLALLPLAPRSTSFMLGIMSLFCLWLAGLYAVFLWSPAPRAAKVGEVLIVRVTPWKRLALPIVLPLPAWLLALTSFRHDPRVGWWIGGTIALMGALYWSTRDRFHVTDWGVSRAVAGLGPKQKIAWSGITRLGLWPAGITLGAPGKPTVSLYGIMLDGYPELVREVLRRIPHVIDATSEARERLERIAALVPGDKVAPP